MDRPWREVNLNHTSVQFLMSSSFRSLKSSIGHRHGGVFTTLILPELSVSSDYYPSTTGEVVLLVEEIAGESPAISSTRSTLIESINKIILYRPEFCLLDHINLLLLGPVGSGKSSLFNTIESTFKGTIKSRARAGDGVIPITKQVIIRKNRYRKISNFREIRREFWKDLITIGLLFVYTVCAKAEDLYFPLGIVHGRMLYLCIFQFWRYSISPQSSREPLNIRICDAPGVSVNSISPTDLAYMLDGHLSDRFLKTNLQQFNSNNFDFH